MGKLYLVPTPIGNLEDITLRALRILKEADCILAEDTRTTRKLLSHYQIGRPMLAYHVFNEHQFTPQLVERMLAGQVIALVSDAGTPGISDPGFLLVRACIDKTIEVECLPGATALIPALAVSGLPADRFCFEGFLPHKKGRKTRIAQLADETRSIILYESPHRILKLVQELIAVLGGERRCSLSRELSKIHEETIRGSLANLASYLEAHPPKGEMVLVISAP